jgi:hypothetical protein
MTSYFQDHVEYDVQQHYDMEWIQMSVRTLTNLYENTDHSLAQSYYEDFTVAFFRSCIDFCMKDMQLRTDIKRSLFLTILPLMQSLLLSTNIVFIIFIELMHHC